jgi:conjugative relaxase-like TrwC/TraI family protein
MVVAQQVPQPRSLKLLRRSLRQWVVQVLTISKLKQWSINYYIDTARTAATASRDAARAGGGLGEYYTERETRTPTWLLAGDTHSVAWSVGLANAQRAGSEADSEMVARWLDDGTAPNGAQGRAFGQRGVHGFDLTFCAPKSVSLVRALRGDDDVLSKAIADAHSTAISEAMEYLASHAGYTRIHNPHNGEKDLVRLPGLAAIAYQHETSRCGDPHLHTHVIVPNRQARADGAMVSIDGTSLYHEARAAGVIYQATLRRELHNSLGLEWEPVDPSTGMAELAGVDRDTIIAWSRRSTQPREWAANKLTLADEPLTASQLATAQKATRPSKPEELAWTQLVAQWRTDPRGLHLDRAAFDTARAARRASARTPFSTARILGAAEQIDKAAFTRADLIEILGAQLPVHPERTPRELLESAVDQVAVRLTAPRAAHQREGHERYTLDAILREETALLDLVDAQNNRAMLWIKKQDTALLSVDQARAVENIGRSPWLVQPLSAPAGAGKTTSMRALRTAANRRIHGTVIVLAPTGKAVDVAVREGAGDRGYTIAKVLQLLRDNQLDLGPHTLVVVDEAAMVGTTDLLNLLTATTQAGAKTVLVGDQHQLAPVKARGGMFAQLCADLPWTQHLSAVWRMRDPDERAASLALRNGGPASVRRAIGWYRTRGRLRCGDQITMAAEALAAYQADTAAGKDALLLCDTTEMAEALNRRIHQGTVPVNAARVTGARGNRIAVGDVILTRHNDASIPLRNVGRPEAEQHAVRNGQRWEVVQINTKTNQLAARRQRDSTLAVFDGGYVREHVTYGYAMTVHSAQGVTADTVHAVLGDSATRALAYVAMTRGREVNAAYLYRHVGEQEHGDEALGVGHVALRGDSQLAARMLRTVVANDEQPATAHSVAAPRGHEMLPTRVRSAVDHRAAVLRRRGREYERWRAGSTPDNSKAREASRHNSGMDLSSDDALEI